MTTIKPTTPTAMPSTVYLPGVHSTRHPMRKMPRTMRAK